MKHQALFSSKIKHIFAVELILKLSVAVVEDYF